MARNSKVLSQKETERNQRQLGCESHEEQIECKSMVTAKGGDHPDMTKSHKLTQNQVKSESVVFPKGGDVNTVN